MDSQSIYTTRTYNSTFSQDADTHIDIQDRCEKFIQRFQDGPNSPYVYRFVSPDFRSASLRAMLTDFQRSAERKCAPQEILLRHQHWSCHRLR